MSTHKTILFSDNLPIKITTHSNEVVESHWHTPYEIIFVLSGKVTIIENGKVIQLKKEDIYLFNSFSSHEIFGNTSEVISFYIDFKKLELSNIEGESSLKFDLNSAGKTHSQYFDYIRYILAQLVNAKERSFPVYQSMSLLYSLLNELSTYFLPNVDFQPIPISKHKARVTEIISYIDEHYSDSITLTDLASAQNLSVPYLASFFEKYMGTTFLAYYNNLRLTRTVNEMLSSSETLEDIALKNGFRDNRSFVALFKKNFGCLPSAYRKENNVLNISESEKYNLPKVESEDSNPLSTLRKYLFIYKNSSSIKSANLDAHKYINAESVDFLSKGDILKNNFHTFCTAGSAKQLLYTEIQEMLTKSQKEIGYKFIKFHGIISDEMHVYVEDELGNSHYSFTLVEKVLDFLLSINLKPLIQISFMPVDLASVPSKMLDMRNFNVSPPKDMGKWIDLVTAFTNHLISRYGSEEVRSWLFCVWNEPDTTPELFGWDDDLEFFEFYKYTYQAVKKIDPKIQFGSPSLLLSDDISADWDHRFYEYGVKNDCLCDFLNIHYYDNDFSIFTSGESEMSPYDILSGNTHLSMDDQSFKKTIDFVDFWNKKYNPPQIPIYLTEWNLTVSQRSLINDTCFIACYLIKNLLENYDRLASYGYWCLSDFVEEFQFPTQLFHGGLGMFTYNGIPKAHYHAFKFLTRMDNELIAKGNGYFITKSEKRVSIMLYNYEHYSPLFASGFTSDVTITDRYAPFVQMQDAKFGVTLKNLPGESCLIRESYVNQVKGSCFDTWVRMGAQPMTHDDELDILRYESQPGLYLHTETIENGELELQTRLEPLEVRIINIELQN